MEDDGDGIRDVALTRSRRRAAVGTATPSLREEPLEIQVRGVPVAVVMRTPGTTREHGARLSRHGAGSCGRRRASPPCATVASSRIPTPRTTSSPSACAATSRVDLEALRRNLFTSASCGICGKASIEQALAVAPPLDDRSAVAPDVVRAVMAQLAAAQPVVRRDRRAARGRPLHRRRRIAASCVRTSAATTPSTRSSAGPWRRAR
jgi:FdhD protein